MLSECFFETPSGHLIHKISLIFQCFLLLCQLVRFSFLFVLFLYLKIPRLGFIDFFVRFICHCKLRFTLLSMLLYLIQGSMVTLESLLLDFNLCFSVNLEFLLSLLCYPLQSLLAALLLSLLPLLLLLVDPLEHFEMVVSRSDIIAILPCLLLQLLSVNIYLHGIDSALF